MATIVAIANQKGGVGKTTSARCLAYFLGLAGKKTLVIDNDPQASLTRCYGIDPNKCEETTGTMTGVLTKKKRLEEIIIPVSEHLSVAPASRSLTDASEWLVTQPDGNEVLKKALLPIQDDFDIILIDSIPAMGRLLLNSLIAAPWVIIPVKTDTLSVFGIPDLFSTVLSARRGLNPNLDVLGVLPTLYNRGNQNDELALNMLREQGGEVGVRIFDPVAEATNYNKSSHLRKPVFEVFPNTPGREEYEYLANIIMCL